MKAALRWAEDRLGYRFIRQDLLDLALTHRSVSACNNERLEFLGDAVLGLVIADAVYRRRPEAGEGLLSRIRSRLVRGETLADMAREIGLGDLVRLGSGEARTGGHQRSSILSNALEAVLGAIYLDSGMAAAEAVVLRLYASRLEDLPAEEDLRDPKTRLQEWLQARGHRPPSYAVRNVAGAAHAQTFEVVCEIDSLGLAVGGHGASRRIAEQDAAQRALEQVGAGQPDTTAP
ncbi:MAG: ribonuclease 3 [Gammaproteobacteria bacterium]|nr:MAG: ribonuclease III [Pseudomonadota bacterium]MBC6944130.1 ribonuclease III [Gammaproteobacteria bacterium]MCE7896497.1 ribonuclease III [Gammaproteobacteria bacterium PRO8]MDL1880448.1 ribonuclease III [Gammaproteobacteria bacterium PRO2]MCQ3933490.1 ribonuclease III [Gammaproteobacteria bacterium]